MKKQAFVVLFALSLLPCIACADEMVVNLKSGNSLVIQYTGTIHGVTMQGDSDAIAAMNMTAKPKKESSASTSAQDEKSAGETGNKAEGKDGKEGGMQLKWAAPIEEDNPFPKR